MILILERSELKNAGLEHLAQSGAKWAVVPASLSVEDLRRAVAANEKVETEPTPLTRSEIEILRLIARGLSVKEIASNRNLSAHTVVTHKKNIFRKLRVSSVHEATRYALRAGLVDPIEYYI